MPRRRPASDHLPKLQRADNGSWYIYLGKTEKGRPRKVYADKDSVKTERQAVAWREKIVSAWEAQGATAGDLTVYGLCQVYLKDAEDRADRGELTQGQYRTLASRLTTFWETAPAPGAPPLKGRLAREIDGEDLAACVRAWKRPGACERTGGPYTAHYRKGLVRAVRATWRWAARKVPGRTPERLLLADPLEGFQAEKLPPAQDRFVEAETIRRFLRWAWARARRQKGLAARFDRLYLLLFQFCRLTGCRPGEACKLRWTDIRWAEGLIVLEKHKTAETTGRPRVIYVTIPVARLLRAIERLSGHHPDFVFTHMRGTRARERGHADPIAGEPWPDGSAASAKLRAFREAAIQEGVPGLEKIGPKRIIQYTGRHVYATEGLQAKMTQEQVGHLLGHTTGAQVGTVYGRFQKEHGAKLAEKLARRGRGSGGK